VTAVLGIALVLLASSFEQGFDGVQQVFRTFKLETKEPNAFLTGSSAHDLIARGFQHPLANRERGRFAIETWNRQSTYSNRRPSIFGQALLDALLLR
jgi:hypothetical protein